MAGGRWQMADGIWLKMTTRVPVHANVLKSLQNANALDLAPVAQVRAAGLTEALLPVKGHAELAVQRGQV